MPERLTGALYSYQSHFLYVGPLIASARHRHHAGQVMWVPDGVSVVDEHGLAQHGTMHLVAPDRYHGHAAARAAAVLWVDCDDLRWDRALQARATSHVRRAAWPAQLDSLSREQVRSLAQSLLEVVMPEDDDALTRVPQHPAVQRMCALLDSASTEREVSFTQLARHSGLSARQLRHRFTEEVGINPSAYLRWRRLRRAFACIERGANLTQAAVDAGFADGAHFSRVFQAQFGMAPSQALTTVCFAGTLGQ